MANVFGINGERLRRKWRTPSALRVEDEICEDGFSSCGDLRVDCARAAVFSGTKDWCGYATADHAPGILLRFYLCRRGVAGSIPDPIEGSDQVPADDDPRNARKDWLSGRGPRSLSSRSRGAGHLHPRRTRSGLAGAVHYLISEDARLISVLICNDFAFCDFAISSDRLKQFSASALLSFFNNNSPLSR